MKIKIYNSNVQRQAPLGKAMETPESLGAGVGRAGREFGDTAFNAFNEAEKKDQILKSNSDVSDFEVSQGQILADLKRDAPLDGSGVHEKFIAQYQKGREDLLKDKGAFYKDHAILRLDNMKSQFESSIIDYSARQNILKRSYDTDNFTENQAKMVRQNPAELQARYDESIRNIDSARLPPDVRLQHYDKAKKALKQAPVDHIRDMIATNPTGAMSLLDTEDYQKLINDPQKLAELKRETESFLMDVDTRKKKLYDAMNPEEAEKRAITQTVNGNMFKEKWNDKKTGLKKKGNIYDIFEYRGSLLNSFLSGDLDKKDYAERMGETIDPILTHVKNDRPGNPILWNKSFDTAILAIDSKVNLKDEPDEVKAYVYDETYSMFKEKNIDPEKRSGIDDKIIDEIVSKVSQGYLRNKEPALIGIEANKVLLGTQVYDYKIGDTKKISTGDYKIFQDKNGQRYKAYKDKDGKFSDNSVFQRIIK